jgi:hypothetical protein
MFLARRKFVQSSLLFTASTLLFWENTRSVLAQTLVGDDRQLSTEVLRDPIFRFTRETFEPYVNGYFEAPGARGKMIALKLIKVEVYDPKGITRTSVATDAFRLLFSAEAELPTFTSIHPIKHGALGEFSLFLTRLSDGPGGEIYYEAVFNHLR